MMENNFFLPLPSENHGTSPLHHAQFPIISPSLIISSSSLHHLLITFHPLWCISSPSLYHPSIWHWPYFHHPSNIFNICFTPKTTPTHLSVITLSLNSYNISVHDPHHHSSMFPTLSLVSVLPLSVIYPGLFLHGGSLRLLRSLSNWALEY